MEMVDIFAFPMQNEIVQEILKEGYVVSITSVIVLSMNFRKLYLRKRAKDNPHLGALNITSDWELLGNIAAVILINVAYLIYKFVIA
jgi:hypothetical protein